MTRRIDNFKDPYFDITSTVDGKTILNTRRANLIGYDFSEKDLQNADLRGLNLSGADFTNAKISGSDLSECNLTGCNFSGCTMIDVTFDGSVLQGAIGLDRTTAGINGIQTFYSSSWKNCDFSGVDLDWVEFATKEMVEEFFSGCKGIEQFYNVYKVRSSRDFISYWK